jgi:UDP-N-acetylglucosamine 2-epimerase (non-hydrolysing)
MPYHYSMTMRVLSVVGARPQFVKLAPVHKALESGGHQHIIVHTGQHYDRDMSDVFFEDLGIPPPDENLAVGSASHGKQTGLMLDLLEQSFLRHRPDWVLVYGDTNSTLAAAVAAVKIHVPLAHLEAGLRSFNRLMPEEHNRVLTDHAADLLLAPTDVAYRHLVSEGLGHRTVVVGDVMTDVCLTTLNEVTSSPPLMPDDWENRREYAVATVHRQENTDDPSRLARVIDHLASTSLEVRLLAHPRLRSKAREFGINIVRPNVRVFDPLPYPQLVHAVSRSVGVVTDSGGLQKEAFILGRPCITLRTETEWVETVESGWNTIDADCTQPIEEVLRARRLSTVNPYGDGHAAEKVVAALKDNLR